MRTTAELSGRHWDVLALTVGGCRKLRGAEIDCGVLILPGDCGPEALRGVRMEQAVSYGLSARDSLTLSSLREPVLCIQRALRRPDGGVVEPQEIPLFWLPAPADRLLPVLGLRLLLPWTGR